MRAIRRSIVLIVMILLGLGIIMVYSASAIYGHEKLHDSTFFIKRHLIYFCIGLVAMITVMLVPLDLIRRVSKPAAFAAIVLLLVVLVPGVGRELGGARRWFNFGLINFQPSEYAKISLILYLAGFLSRKGKDVRDLVYGYLPAVIMIGGIVGLVLLEPDLGTAVDVGVIGFVMLFVSGARIRHIVSTFLMSLPVLYMQLFSVSYRRRRLVAFLNPWADSKGDGFQIIQSLVALASGGLFGVGLGQSRQKLFYLPEPYSDFIFSILGEELGFLGTGSVIVLFMILLIQGIKIVMKSENDFGRMLAVGVVTMISFEVIVNIGVVTGALPTKGLPLPFISYGGTSLIFHMIAIGLLLNVSRQPYEAYE